jgi:methionine biosynthesis protein MetW
MSHAWSTKPRADVYNRDFSAGLAGKYQRVYDLVPCNSRVLELGCSTGYFTEHLVKKCAAVVALDCDVSSIRACRERGIAAFQCDLSSDHIVSLLTDQAPFDTIVAMDLLEHLPRPQDLLTRLHRLIDQRGQLIVTGPNVAYWHTRWELMRGRWNYTEAGIMDDTHLRWFTRATWRKLLEESGFMIVVDQVVDSLLPKEYQMRSLPGFGRFVDKAKVFSEKILPNLVATVFLFCCHPIATERQ